MQCVLRSQTSFYDDQAYTHNTCVSNHLGQRRSVSYKSITVSPLRGCCGLGWVEIGAVFIHVSRMCLFPFGIMRTLSICGRRMPVQSIYTCIPTRSLGDKWLRGIQSSVQKCQIPQSLGRGYPYPTPGWETHPSLKMSTHFFLSCLELSCGFCFRSLRCRALPCLALH